MSKYVKLEDVLNALGEIKSLPVASSIYIKTVNNINALPTIDDGWVRVGDGFPKTVGYYLTWTAGFSRPLELYFDGHFMTTDRSSVGITHWQPLPSPPTLNDK